MSQVDAVSQFLTDLRQNSHHPIARTAWLRTTVPTGLLPGTSR
jgi:hypothetical protein